MHLFVNIIYFFNNFTVTNNWTTNPTGPVKKFRFWTKNSQSNIGMSDFGLEKRNGVRKIRLRTQISVQKLGLADLDSDKIKSGQPLAHVSFKMSTIFQG